MGVVIPSCREIPLANALSISRAFFALILSELVVCSGLDVVPILEWIGASEKVISAFKLPGVGNAAVAYLCYKIATPAR